MYKKNIYDLIDDKVSSEIIIENFNTLNLSDAYTLTLFLIMKDNKEIFDLLSTNNCIKNKLDVERINSWDSNLEDLIKYCEETNQNYYLKKLKEIKNSNKLKLK